MRFVHGDEFQPKKPLLVELSGTQDPRQPANHSVPWFCFVLTVCFRSLSLLPAEMGTFGSGQQGGM